MKPRPIPRSLLVRLKRVKLFLCDVDGVLTNGTVSIREGAETKTFHVRDGIGLRFLQRTRASGSGGFPPQSIGGDDGARHGAEGGFPPPGAQWQDRQRSRESWRRPSWTWAEVAWMGDDVLDLGALERAGFSAVPGDAMPEARARAHHVCRAFGGRGAVREVVEMILRAQGHWDRIVERLSQT